MGDDGLIMEDIEARTALEPLDLDKANLDDLAGAMMKIEAENVGRLEEIRQNRLRLSDKKADQSDIYYYLHKKLDDNYDVISALERQLMVETADREKAETEYGGHIDELEHRMDEELAPLNDKLITVEEQVNSMHEAAENKRESDANRARLEKELKAMESIVESDLNVERRKKLQEKQRVRRQIEEQIKGLSTELFSKKEVELADKAVRAADNNGKLHTALQAKAKQAERMMVVNQGLAFENNTLQNDVELARASETVLGKRVRLYHDLVVGLKAQLEQEASSIHDEDEKKLADLEEALADSGGGSGWSGESGRGNKVRGDARVGLDTMSLNSDAATSSQAVWAGGACEGLVYESVDELRVAVDSVKRLHAELQEEERKLTARAEEARARSARPGDSDDGLVTTLLEVTKQWVSRSKPTSDEKTDDEDGGLFPSPVLVAENAWDPTGTSRGGKSRNRRKTTSSRRGRVTCNVTGGRGLLMSPGAGVGRRQELTCGGAGPLAKATATALHRRELFYYLVDAFRGYQARVQDAVGVVGMPGETQKVDGGLTKGADDARGAGFVADSTCGGCGQLPSISEPGGSFCGTSGGGIGDAGAGGVATSASDLSSMSIRTLYDFGAPEHRSASTQTVAKHFPEKFASVRPARRLVVSSTFLTCNSISSTSTARSGGYGALSADTQPQHRHF